VLAVVTTTLPGRPAGASDEELAALVSRVGRTRWTSNNTIELLADPRRAWEARLDLVESAEHHLFVTTFSWKNDDHGTRLRKVLENRMRDRAAAGDPLIVRCLADATAMGLFTRSFDDLRELGARVRSYNRQSWGMAPVYDGRMHDKIMIADGRQAIVGGRNYSDIYYDPRHWWLDFGVLIEGAAVWDLQMVFLKSWAVASDLTSARRIAWPLETIERRIRTLWATGRFPDGRSPLAPELDDRFFPADGDEPGGTRVAVLYDNSLVWDRAPTLELLIELVRGAETEIDLMTPFPNFPSELTDALVDAVGREVRVRLIVNHRDAAIRGGLIRLSAYPTLIRLVGAGAEVWAWKANPELLAEVAEVNCAPAIMPPIALHGKIARVDDALTIVHSSNFNIRSAYYNTEAGVAVLDRGFNARMERLLDGLLSLHSFDLQCTNGDRQVIVDRLVTRLGDDDVAVMRRDLGARQKFLDGMSLLW
jgi:phosphatidylserine/phosphatidylglycerophosphate/cardiolipin synthase-like enzyme